MPTDPPEGAGETGSLAAAVRAELEAESPDPAGGILTVPRTREEVAAR